MDQFRLEDFTRKLLESLPPSLQSFKGELKAHADRVLQEGIGKLNLVSREEFEAQARVLVRSRELIERLEARLAELEARLGEPR
jgi:ubiquinone biosynthesis accessory factor UbiK